MKLTAQEWNLLKRKQVEALKFWNEAFEKMFANNLKRKLCKHCNG